jgi:16S rRNA processing protein RimM
LRFSNNENTKIEKTESDSLAPVRLGEIVRPHGLKGALFVHAPQSDKHALEAVKQVLIGRDPAAGAWHALVEANWMPKGWKLTIADVQSIEAAESLRGNSVFLARAELSAPESNEYFVQDLVGCVVIDRVRGEVGILESVEPATLGTDRWWVKTPEGEQVAMPAIRRFIVSVHLGQKEIHVAHFDELT